MEGSIAINDNSIDIEVKNRKLLSAKADIEGAVDVAGQWAGGQFVGPSSWYDMDKRMYALRGKFTISEGSAEYVATEIKTALESKGYAIVLKKP